jgi:hypothetical protein
LVLRSVGDREQESFVHGGPANDYHQYLAVIKTQAILYDEKSLGNRTANMANLDRDMDELEESEYREEPSDIEEMLVHLTKRRAPRTSMNKETWASLSPEGKTTWDKLNESDKQKVLQYVTKRNEKDSMEANQHEVIETNENDVVQTEDKDKDNEAKLGEINNAVTKRKEVHPGDLRRMMGGVEKGKAKTGKSFNVNFLNPEHQDDSFLEDTIQAYWNSDPEDKDFY